jgi:Ca2+-binding EF-hand superfamily protein
MIRSLAVLATLTLTPTATLAQEQPKPVTKAELTAQLSTDFADLDTNKDGKASRDEVLKRVEKDTAAQIALLGQRRDAAFKKADANGDGSISKAEFEAATPLPQAPAATADPAMAQFDTNKDGAITKAEFEGPTLANFALLDANKDGTLSVAEQQAAAGRTAQRQQASTVGR